jgi:rod shape-determining protein MreD
VVLGLEFLRAREAIWRDMPYLFEWMMVSATIISASLGYMVVLALFSVDQPPLGLSLVQIFATIATYPLVELFSSRILGLRRMAPGAVDQLGRKI